MSDTKDEIAERVLQSLRDTQPAQGMEIRIVDAVRHRAYTQFPPNRSPGRTAALTGSAIAASVLCALLLIPHSKTPRVSGTRPKAASRQTVNGPVVSSLTAKLATPKQAIRKTNRAAALPPQENLAAVSYPAPPMPLTEQEKLLLRLAHKGDPVQLAMLDPVQRETKYADERAQVQKFFTPATQETISEP